MSGSRKGRGKLESQESRKGSVPTSEKRPWVLYPLVCLAYYLAQPPVQWPIFAWLFCGGFAWLVLRYAERPRWWVAWFASSAMWLALLHGIRLAFWPLTAGWIALSLYLAVYFPIAIGIASQFFRVYRVPLPLACAIAWTTTEVLRSYMLTGFAACALAHSQTPWPMVLQVASQFGGYGVGFFMMLSMAWVIESITRLRNQHASPFTNDPWWYRMLRSMTRTAILLWFALTYVTWVSRDNFMKELQPVKPLGRFVLVQDHMPTIFDATPDTVETGWDRYEETTRKAIASLRNADSLRNPIDAIVWPESVYAGVAPYVVWDRGPSVPSELNCDRETLEAFVDELTWRNELKLKRLRLANGGPLPNLIVGTDVRKIEAGKLDIYNSALWVPAGDGAPDFYAKSHLVMFGEYIPVLSWFPSVQKMIGLVTLSSGTQPKAWEIANGRRVMANVCFEDMVPHLMQRQIAALTKKRTPPDVLVNISNDGWFRGSSMLDHHFNCAILAAVENRIPVLVSANTGITGWIDGSGRVVERLPKMESGWLIADPVPDGRSGWWSWWGDLPARVVACIGLFPTAFRILARSKAHRWLRRVIIGKR